MIAEHETPVASYRLHLEKTFALERRLVASGWQNPVELVRAADCLSLDLADFSDRLCGTTVGYLWQCTERNGKPSWSDAAEYLSHLGVTNVDDLYFLLVDTLVPEDDSITDLAQQVQRAADQRADEDCRYVTRKATLAVLHALGCPRCQRCAKSQSDVLPRSVRPSKRRRRVVVCG